MPTPNGLVDIREHARENDVDRATRDINRLDPFNAADREAIIEAIIGMANRDEPHLPVLLQDDSLRFMPVAQLRATHQAEAYRRTVLFLIRLLKDTMGGARSHDAIDTW